MRVLIAEYPPPSKVSVQICGDKTSVSMTPLEVALLEHFATRDRMSRTRYISNFWADYLGTRNFSAALRCHLMERLVNESAVLHPQEQSWLHLAKAIALARAIKKRERTNDARPGDCAIAGLR